MVTVAQLAERWIVVPNVVGSSPISHPKGDFERNLPFFVRTNPSTIFIRRGWGGNNVMVCEPGLSSA